MYRYGDNYPEACPPLEATAPTQMKLYRICKSKHGEENLEPEDFVPVFETSGRTFPPRQLCKSKALSFEDNLEEIKRKMFEYPNIGNRIVECELNENCGVLLQTGNISHYSLWDLYDPDVVSAIGNHWEEVE